MKFYIASKLDDAKRVLSIMRELESMGHTITHKWPLTIDGKVDMMAAYDARGVINCQTFVALFDKPFLPHFNAYVELGIAIALEKYLIVIGHYDDYCIFTELSSVVRYDSVEQFLEVARHMKK